MGDGADVREVHISACLCCGAESVQHQYNHRGHHAGEDSGFCCSRCLCHVVAWSSACLQRTLYQVVGKWVSCKVVAVPNIRSPVAEVLPPADGCVGVREP